jgi:hypothetical protein
MTEESWFDSMQRQETFLHNFQGGCETHTSSSLMGMDGLFFWKVKHVGHEGDQIHLV